MKLQYLFWVTCEYEKEYQDFFGSEEWEHGFYSKSNNPENIKRTAKRYFKKHHIPAVILRISEPEMKLIIN